MIFCATDNIALGTMKSIFSNGMNIPSNISVVGFGDYTISQIYHPSLTTVRFNYYYAGSVAGTNIIKLIKGETINRITVSNFKIILRESVDIIK